MLSLAIKAEISATVARFRGSFPNLQTVANERLVPPGAWSAVLGARRFSVRYVTFKRVTTDEPDVRHLSPYSQIHYFKKEGRPDHVVRDDVVTLCGLQFREGATFFDERSNSRARDCPYCIGQARINGLVIMEEVREYGGTL
jgi:hypothetical protein